MPEMTETVRKHITMLCNLAGSDLETLRSQIECSLEVAFIEGYNAAMKEKG